MFPFRTHQMGREQKESCGNRNVPGANMRGEAVKDVRAEFARA